MSLATLQRRVVLLCPCFCYPKLNSREIEAVDRNYITVHYRAYGGPKPPPIDHKGINDVFVGKASVVYYLYKGEWLQLTGAD